jgi:hypothetical protein
MAPRCEGDLVCPTEEGLSLEQNFSPGHKVTNRIDKWTINFKLVIQEITPLVEGEDSPKII